MIRRRSERPRDDAAVDEALVEAAYLGLLGRSPDRAGGATGSASCATGCPGSASSSGWPTRGSSRPGTARAGGPAAARREPSDPAERLVSAAYRAILGREPDPAGGEHWADVIRRGLPWEEFLRAVMDAEEADLGGRFRELERAGADVVVPLSGLPPEAGRLRFCAPAADTGILPTLLASGGLWEPHVTDFLGALLRPGDAVIDAGANFGYVTVLAAGLVGPAGRVVAFEPNPAARLYCELNARLNALTRVEVLPLGLWHERGALRMTMPAHLLAGARLVPPGTERGEPMSEEEVELAALDDLIAAGRLPLEGCRLVKMDIEGAEPSALDGMSAFLDRALPVILSELNPHCLEFFGRTPLDLYERLAARGYTVCVLPQQHQRADCADLPAVPGWGEVELRRIDDPARVPTLTAADEPLDLVALPPGDGGRPA